ncbi:glucosamine-6-phosphate deaminase [Bacillus nakamurai]|uniref:Glucosamine-6-phosphate deaminase n=1 Tax=Bacillus nakamurai TaxID=1793963 RepID=A0A150F4W3_9BACI|nr:glucosamine-6-phosphate deaminase [Bacillus nakamurai]KXZ17231.1 glucosamine-6-phosphate deaminase [Bacillus nakamurai]KXZ17310.1 glucosamine-6-phosphate deaminase [Bacillus nakamurai]MCC9022328.1 glucosamine-6-phosphate deaminase [Bacillus nakamurai]MCP6682199.1 glucosamine-6-phosphate deaminase [Bacillus nakamurai]MED1228811.1 glucosamine-6-phosphate deaminase [Bacillus nakamurai]
MNVIKCRNYEELSQKAAAIIAETVKQKPDAVLGLATGGTPEGVYKELVRMHRTEGLSFQNVSTINLDEYAGLSPEDKNSYHYYMNTHLFAHIDSRKDRHFLPDGQADDLDAECERYDRLAASLGGTDIQLLGIGHNGHIGFNEPGTPFQSRTHVVELDEETRQANARYFSSIDQVPKKAVTMGIETILSGKRILIMASGKSKAQAVKQLLDGRISESFPASALHLHPDVTVLIDEEAAG